MSQTDLCHRSWYAFGFKGASEATQSSQYKAKHSHPSDRRILEIQHSVAAWSHTRCEQSSQVHLASGRKQQATWFEGSSQPALQATVMQKAVNDVCASAHRF